MSKGDNIDTGGFAEVAKDATESGGDSASTLKRLFGEADGGTAKSVARNLIKARGDGEDIEAIQEKLNCGRGPAHAIRGVERATGVEGIPPVAEIIFGLYTTLRGGRNAE